MTRKKRKRKFFSLSFSGRLIIHQHIQTHHHTTHNTHHTHTHTSFQPRRNSFTLSLPLAQNQKLKIYRYESSQQEERGRGNSSSCLIGRLIHQYVQTYYASKTKSTHTIGQRTHDRVHVGVARQVRLFFYKSLYLSISHTQNMHDMIESYFT